MNIEVSATDLAAVAVVAAAAGVMTTLKLKKNWKPSRSNFLTCQKAVVQHTTTATCENSLPPP